MVFLRYVISGSAAAITHFAALIVLVELFEINATFASAIGFCAAILVNYTLQYYWTFKTRGTHSATFVRYLIVTVLMLIVNTALFWLLHVKFGLSYLVAQAIATLVIVAANYQINQRFTFAQSLVSQERGEVI